MVCAACRPFADRLAMMRALIDEAVPLVRGHHAYVVVATILVANEESLIKEALDVVIGERISGFHWAREGPKARQRMVECLVGLGACAHVAIHHPTGRRRQEEARAAALSRHLPLMLMEGATEILIESRGQSQDRNDRVLLLDELSSLGRKDVIYGWADKTTSALWLPDAVCGAVAEFLTGSDPRWYEVLQGADVIQDPIYIQGA